MAKNNQKGKGFDADFDTFWKEALDLVEPATAFFLPGLHAVVDWSKDYQSLEQELRSLRAKKKGVLRRTDKLFKLFLRDGSERVVFYHLEAEAFPDLSFPQRVFMYFTLLNAKFNFAPITILAIFVGETPKHPLNQYSVSTFGTDFKLAYNVFNVAEEHEADLMESENPFALVVLANLYVIRSRQNPELRMYFKRKLVAHLYNKRIDLQKFHRILNFALHFVRLPEEKEEEFQVHFFETYNKEDMSGAEEALAYGKKLTDRLSSHLYGETTEEAQRRSEEAQRRSEKEYRARIEAERAREEAQRKMADSILNLHQKLGWSAEKIADALELSLSDVQAVLKKV
jgi:hypothetical protein